MKSFALGLSVFLVILGAYSSRKYQIEGKGVSNQEVLSQTQEAQEPDSSPTDSTSPTLPPTHTPTPKPTRPPSSSISAFVYPGASLKSQTTTSLALESNDDTDKITDWYKTKIEELGMNVKSFVTTRANDKVLNKLSAADGAREINVEISKQQGTSLVVISVGLKNF